MSSIKCHMASQGIVTQAGTANSGNSRDPGHSLPSSGRLCWDDANRKKKESRKENERDRKNKGRRYEDKKNQQMTKYTNKNISIYIKHKVNKHRKE